MKADSEIMEYIGRLDLPLSNLGLAAAKSLAKRASEIISNYGGRHIFNG